MGRRRRRRRRRGGFFSRIGRAISRVGRGIGRAVRKVTDTVGITKKKSKVPVTSTPAPAITQSPPVTSTTGLQSSAQSSGQVDPGIIAMRRGRSTSTVPPSVVQFVGKDRKDEMMNVFGSLDKEYTTYEKPPISKVINLDGDVTWGHKDLPAVLLDWSEYLDQDEKDRIQYYKILQWVPGKENDEIPQASRQRVLSPVDWFKKYVDSANYREKDNSSKSGRTYRKKRRYRGMSSPKQPPVRKKTGGSLVKHKTHWHEKNKSKYPKSTKGAGGKYRGPVIRDAKKWRADNNVTKRKKASITKSNRRTQVKRNKRRLKRRFIGGGFRRRRGRR